MGEPIFIRPEVFWQDLGLRAEQSVVHLGCGAGFYLIPAARIVGKRGHVSGVDVLAPMLEATDARAVRDGVAAWVHTVRANLESPGGSSLPSGQADWVLLANIMHQSDPNKLLQESKRLVKPNTGQIVVVEWNTAATPIGPPAAARISQVAIQELATGLKLQLARQFSPSPYHFGLVFTNNSK